MRRNTEGEENRDAPLYSSQENAPLVRNSERSAHGSLRLLANDDLNRPSLQGVTRPNQTYGEGAGENTLIHGSNDVKERTEKFQWYLKLCTGALIIIILLKVTTDPNMLPEEHVKCMRDGFFRMTEGINNYFAAQSVAKNAIVGSLAIILDLGLLLQLFLWTFYAKSWRYPIAVVFLYFTRFLMSALYKMTYPYNYIWEFPGVYSLTVAYGQYSAFYFSQTIGISVINMLEFRDRKLRLAQWIMALAIFGLSLMLLFCRGHYSIDIFGGFIFGHYFWIFAENRSWIIDYALMKIPFHKRFPLFQTNCSKCKAPVNRWAVHLRNDFPGQVTNMKIDNEKIGIKIDDTPLAKFGSQPEIVKEVEFKYPKTQELLPQSLEGVNNTLSLTEGQNFSLKVAPQPIVSNNEKDFS